MDEFEKFHETIVKSTHEAAMSLTLVAFSIFFNQILLYKYSCSNYEGLSRIFKTIG